jgi:hypothetical protein
MAGAFVSALAGALVGALAGALVGALAGAFVGALAGVFAALIDSGGCTCGAARQAVPAETIRHDARAGKIALIGLDLM